jgi:hypothetical protein
MSAWAHQRTDCYVTGRHAASTPMMAVVLMCAVLAGMPVKRIRLYTRSASIPWRFDMLVST